MNIHMSMSILRKTASPRKSPEVIVIVTPAMRARSSSTERTQRSMVRRMTRAGKNEKSARKPMQWDPKSSLPAMTIHR